MYGPRTKLGIAIVSVAVVAPAVSACSSSGGSPSGSALAVDDGTALTMWKVITVVGTLGVSTLGGYAFARFKFPGRNLVFLATLAILMVPYATILIPLYVLLTGIHLQGSLLGLGLVLIMFQLRFATFMMRTAFEADPTDLDDVAQIDGCASLGVLRG